MKTAIRLDDITPDMDWVKYRKVEEILNRNNLRPLIGVVPFNSDDNLRRSEAALDEEEYKSFLKGRLDAGWVAALHGYSHVYKTKCHGLFPLNNFSEFAGVEYEEQKRRIKEGRTRLLELGIDTDIFMAPGHTYDRYTLEALAANGIKRVTDGFGSAPYERHGLIFYPISRRRSDCTKACEAYTTLVLHTNTMTDAEIEEFGATIEANRNCFIDYSEYLKAAPVKRTFVGCAIEYMTAYAKYLAVKLICLIR